MNVGDPVTVLIVGDHGLVAPHAALVTQIWWFDMKLVDRDDVFVGMHLADEGVRWCRGHSGPAVDALLAAQALT